VTGWLGLVVLAVSVAAVLVMWRWQFPVSFSRHITASVRCRWRAWHYRRRWAAVMIIGRLAPVYQGRILLPLLGKVSATRFTDRVQVRLVSGQSAADFAARADNLAHGFGAMLCRIRSASPGALVLEFVRRDALAAIIPALPLPARVDLRTLPVGRREDGLVWVVRVHGTHVLIAGATGAGKASLLWSIVRAMLPAMVAGLVRIWAADPKLMELAYGRAIFDRYGRYAADPKAIVAMLEDAVEQMQARAAIFAGKHREHPNARAPVHRDRGR
jgi:DNA segregation ATPase FtsK/SpoIIIE, S-DNA-T family